MVLGDVTLGPNASVWYGCVLRADMDRIVVGEATNVQDGTVVHVDVGRPALIGARVGIGHRAVIHGCTIEDVPHIIAIEGAFGARDAGGEFQESE